MQIPKPRMETQLILIVLIIGLFAGMLSGLVGVGGGIVLVPALIYFLHYDQHKAQGTSLGVLVFPVVIIAFLKYYFDLKKTGDPIDFRVIGLLAAGFVIGGFLGSTLALKIDKDVLRKIFAGILFYTAFKMLEWDVAVVRFVKKIFA